MPNYHSKTLALLGIDAQVSPSAVQLLGLTEKKIGRVLPASVREWYELRGACQLLLEWSNDDPPVGIDRLGEPPQQGPLQGIHDSLLARDLLVFRWENQGVCVWAIQMNGSDDPPVVVAVDPVFKWVECAASFSQHLYSCAWDYAAYWEKLKKDKLLIQAENRPLSAEAHAFLSKHFEPELVTHGWPGDTQYRFCRRDQRMLIWVSEEQADWHLTAESEDSLEQLINSVGPLDGVLSALWSHTQSGESLLRRVRGDGIAESSLPTPRRTWWKRLIGKN